MNDDGGRRRLCKLHDAFEAQQVGTVQRAQQVEEHVERGGWHRGFAGEGERADALVVAAYGGVVAGVAGMLGGVSARRGPALVVAGLARGGEQAPREPERGGGPALGGLAQR